ncbi:MAG TPA: hypothetical protein VKV69_14110 [Actinomycetota bacterium]|nr:hypothetical protein [Actinomycetota bacterium]
MGMGKRLAATAGISLAILVLSGSAAFAHDCFNPQKNAHAPTAGVHYELVGFDQNGPIIEQLGSAKGVGGFIEIAPGVFGNESAVYTHSLGSGNNPHGVVGGPGSQKPNHACDGKGIDYLDACGIFGG